MENDQLISYQEYVIRPTNQSGNKLCSDTTDFNNRIIHPMVVIVKRLEIISNISRVRLPNFRPQKDNFPKDGGGEAQTTCADRSLWIQLSDVI